MTGEEFCVLYCYIYVPLLVSYKYNRKKELKKKDL